jgi:hypothetical protein
MAQLGEGAVLGDARPAQPAITTTAQIMNRRFR